MSQLSRRPRAQASQGAARPCAGMRQITRQAAGGDSGAHAIVAGVPDGEAQQLVRTFGTSTADLQPVADWLIDRGLQTVAMESPGVYWLPRFAAREARGLHCGLIRAAAITRVPGRKSAVLACQWMQTLHSDGLLTASFRPAADLVALRTLLRHRAQRLEHRAPHILHMQQALVQMHIPCSQALSDLTGLTGQRLIRAIVAGERAPQRLAALRHSRCQKAADEIALAVTGPWRTAPLFGLTQALALCDGSTTQRSACEAEIARVFSGITPRCETRAEASEAPPTCTPPRRTPHSHSKNAPAGNTRAHILRLPGGALVAVHGMRDAIAQTIGSALGTDMRKWPADKHFGAWLGLAPTHDLSGGKVRKSRTLKHRHRATPACRMAAQSVSRSHCAFGAFYRRMQGRRGPAQALVATAHKIARTVSHLLKHWVPYHDIGAAESAQRFRAREMRS